MEVQKLVACVAVVGKLNNPLYIKIFEPTDDLLKFHYIVHSSLDVIEEKLNSSRKTPAGAAAPSGDAYLGALFPTENYKIYGYVTNSKVKLIAVLEDVDMKESDLKSFFSRFHTLYVDTTSNPFYKFDQKIESKKFDDKVVALVRTLS